MSDVQVMTLNFIHIFIVTGNFLYGCVMRPASQRFFIYSCICLRILIISYLATFLGTNSLSVRMSRKAINQSINPDWPTGISNRCSGDQVTCFYIWCIGDQMMSVYITCTGEQVTCVYIRFIGEQVTRVYNGRIGELDMCLHRVYWWIGDRFLH